MALQPVRRGRQAAGDVGEPGRDPHHQAAELLVLERVEAEGERARRRSVGYQATGDSVSSAPSAPVWTIVVNSDSIAAPRVALRAEPDHAPPVEQRGERGSSRAAARAPPRSRAPPRTGRDVPEPERERMDEPGRQRAVTTSHGMRHAGRWKKRPIARRHAGGSAQAQTPSGRPSTKSGAATIISTSCWSMCAENSWLPRRVERADERRRGGQPAGGEGERARRCVHAAARAGAAPQARDADARRARR